jgi:hypothetical protein
MLTGSSQGGEILDDEGPEEVDPDPVIFVAGQVAPGLGFFQARAVPPPFAS